MFEGGPDEGGSPEGSKLLQIAKSLEFNGLYSCLQRLTSEKTLITVITYVCVVNYLVYLLLLFEFDDFAWLLVVSDGNACFFLIRLKTDSWFEEGMMIILYWGLTAAFKIE